MQAFLPEFGNQQMNQRGEKMQFCRHGPRLFLRAPQMTVGGAVWLPPGSVSAHSPALSPVVPRSPPGTPRPRSGKGLDLGRRPPPGSKKLPAQDVRTTVISGICKTQSGKWEVILRSKEKRGWEREEGEEGSLEGTGYEEWGKEKQKARGKGRTRTKMRGASGDVNSQK